MVLLSAFGPTLAYKLVLDHHAGTRALFRGSKMRIVCSWCRKEGKAEFVGEKAPLDDPRETHGICVVHRAEVHAHWWASSQVAADSGNDTRKKVAFALFRWGTLLNLTKRMRS